MPRPAKPYLHNDHYVTRAGGEYVKLRHRSEGVVRARALLRDHLKKRLQERDQHGGRVLPSLTVSELFVLFLQAVEAEKSEHTFLDYQRWCVAFAKEHGKRQARDVSRLDAQNFKQGLLNATWVRNKQAPQPYKPRTINHAIIALHRAFNWAIDNELLPEGRNPFRRLKQQPCQGRKPVATKEEYEALLRHCKDDHFRDVLVAMRYTPARPGDVCNLRWAMVEWERRRRVIFEHKMSRTASVPSPCSSARTARRRPCCALAWPSTGGVSGSSSTRTARRGRATPWACACAGCASGRASRRTSRARSSSSTRTATPSSLGPGWNGTLERKSPLTVEAGKPQTLSLALTRDDLKGGK
jgi:hypothetical protein